MNEIILAIITLVGSFLISRYSVHANQKKTDAEIAGIYARLGFDRNKFQAESANTWMDVARKAAEEYERVMNENVSLKKEVGRLNNRISSMQKRIRSLEMKKRKK